ncbi:dehydrin [Lathyrus oleraceus]|uniref:Dehydrin dhn1, variant 2 n=1 Tax=Pisum sativum TaxID=3888 RepID=A0A9D4YLD8_PEA|nr:dehydrin [Pisum sativum]KAI5441782.1 Dehydrin dhn1, variant 2 [Pisum sativum]
MSQYQNQYGAQTRKTDEYGNPMNQVDQYGNPISGGGGLTGEAGRQHYGTTGGATDHGHGQQHRGVDQTTGYGTHTGGVGGYGTKPEYGSTNTGSGYGTGTGYGGSGTTEYVREEHHGDKKGVMDKIKEKIPGTEQSRTHTDGTGYGSTGYGASGGGIGNTGQEYVREERHVHPGDKKHGSAGQEYVKEERRGIGNTGQEYVREEHRVDHGEKKGIMDKIKEKLPGTGGCTGH